MTSLTQQSHTPKSSLSSVFLFGVPLEWKPSFSGFCQWERGTMYVCNLDYGFCWDYWWLVVGGELVKVCDFMFLEWVNLFNN